MNNNEGLGESIMALLAMKSPKFRAFYRASKEDGGELRKLSNRSTELTKMLSTCTSTEEFDAIMAELEAVEARRKSLRQKN